MENTDIIQAAVTQTTAPQNSASYSAAGVTGDYTVFLRVKNLQGRARFSFADSVDAFTGSKPGPSFSISGSITPLQPITKSFSRKEYPDLRFGTTSAVVRLQLDNLTADADGNHTVTYEAWIQWQV